MLNGLKSLNISWFKPCGTHRQNLARRRLRTAQGSAWDTELKVKGYQLKMGPNKNAHWHKGTSCHERRFLQFDPNRGKYTWRKSDITYWVNNPFFSPPIIFISFSNTQKKHCFLIQIWLRALHSRSSAGWNGEITFKLYSYFTQTSAAQGPVCVHQTSSKPGS